MTYKIIEVTCNQIFETPNINNIIIEYANTGSNPLVQNINPSTFIPAVRKAFEQKSKLQNVIFNVLVDNEGNAQGLCVYSMYVNGNSPEMIADVDSIYVTPSLRRKGYGKKMLDTLFQQAKGYGAKGVYFSAPYGSRLDKVYERLFKPVYIDYFKEL